MTETTTKTPFTKDNLQRDGAYLFYYAGGKSRFVARFKHTPRSASSFMKHLIERWSVEDYFELLDNQRLAPLQIVERTGYLQPHVKKALKGAGYPLSLEGRNAYIEEMVIARN
jgi:hypothetical protein